MDGQNESDARATFDEMDEEGGKFKTTFMLGIFIGGTAAFIIGLFIGSMILC